MNSWKSNSNTRRADKFQPDRNIMHAYWAIVLNYRSKLTYIFLLSCLVWKCWKCHREDETNLRWSKIPYPWVIISSLQITVRFRPDSVRLQLAVTVQKTLCCNILDQYSYIRMIRLCSGLSVGVTWSANTVSLMIAWESHTLNHNLYQGVTLVIGKVLIKTLKSFRIRTNIVREARVPDPKFIEISQTSSLTL